MTIEDLKDAMQDAIDKMNAEEMQAENIKLTLYVANGELLKMETTTGEQTISIDYEKNDTAVRMVINIDGMENMQTKQTDDVLTETIDNSENNTQQNFDFSDNAINLKKIVFAKQNRSYSK